MNQKELYQEIYEKKEQLNSLLTESWKLYSNMETWFFWVNLLTILIPLAVLFFTVDRKRLFEISFFGYSAHVIWTVVDGFLAKNNYFNHPHSISYLLPLGITVTAVLFPVVFMLLYQHCTNKGKNFYLYAIIGSFIFAYGFGFLTEAAGMLKMHKGMNLLYLSLIDIVIVFIAFGMTNLFLKIKKAK